MFGFKTRARLTQHRDAYRRELLKRTVELQETQRRFDHYWKLWVQAQAELRQQDQIIRQLQARPRVFVMGPSTSPFAGDHR